LGHLAAREAVDTAVEVHVVPAGQLRMEPGTQLQHRVGTTVDDDLATGGLEHARHELEQRALAGAVAPEHAERLAPAQREAHVAQRPELLALAPGPQQPDEPVLE